MASVSIPWNHLPSRRRGYAPCGRNPTSPPQASQAGKPTLTASAGLLPAMVDLAVTGVPTEGIAVGGLSALAVGVAAVAI
ncbi:hypothetical protein GS451_18885 [Rhodococcus hoagii]|nr:hypothetical protein [Prescottella equi]